MTDVKGLPSFHVSLHRDNTDGQSMAIRHLGDWLDREELLMARGGKKYAMFIVDYFTKWFEAEPLTTITFGKVISFMIRNIICRYGVPMKIISDNETQFESTEFVEFYSQYGI